MTRGQAYNEWIAAANNHCYCSEDVWNAACDWQKAQDKDIPMKYKRMEFNAKLQEENQRLLDRIEGLEKEVESLILESDSLYDQLKYANQC